MTYPIPNYTRVWVRGRIIDLGKAALQEDNYGLALPVTFSPSPKVLLNAGTGQIISTASFKITPAAQDGYFAIQLPATDDPDINPTNFTYSVKEPTGRSYNIVVPAATPPLNSPGDPLHGQPVLDLITIVPSPPAGAGSVQLLTGLPGRGIVSTDNVAGDLVITYTDSTTQNLGPVSGGASKLADLTDVTTTGAAVGQVVAATQVNPLRVGLVRLSPSRFDISHYGAVRSTKITDASMTVGSAVLSSSSYAFQTGDVGKVVGVRGAGAVSTDYNVLANDGVLVATITAVSGGSATLSQAATTSCSGVPAVFGTPIDTALSAAIAACTAAGGGTVYIPTGVWIAQATASFGSKVSFAGAGRGNSIIYVVKLAPGIGASTPWLTSAGGYSYYKDEVNLSDFTADGSFFAATDAYGFNLKMIQVSYTSNSTVQRIAVINNPATAIGYDESINCLIADNVVTNPGRLAAIANAYGSAGGSGIGVAIGGHGPLSMLIRGNFVKGLWSASGGTGHSGILIESAADTLAPAVYESGISVVDNTIEGMFNGVLDCGSGGLSIIDNTIRKCNNGVRIGSNGHPNGFTARDTRIIGNHIESGVSGSGYVGTGITIAASSSAFDSDGRTLVESNVIRDNDGMGIIINGADQTLRHVIVKNNAIRDNSRNGVRVSGTVQNLSVVGNSITGNGTSGITGSIAAISLLAGTTWTDGRLTGNDFYDYKATPTQTNSYVLNGSTLAGVLVEKNTGDVSTTGNVYARKTSTTTISNTTTLATATAFSLALAANTVYILDAFIVYTSTVAAGAKFAWVVPAGASVGWTIAAPGAPTTLGAATSPLTVAGVDGAGSIVARVRGLVTVGSTAGTLTLQVAQNVATADNLTVATQTNAELRKVA